MSNKKQQNESKEVGQQEKLTESQKLPEKEVSSVLSESEQEENLKEAKVDKSIYDIPEFQDKLILKIFSRWTGIYGDGYICPIDKISGTEKDLLNKGVLYIFGPNVYIKEPYLSQLIAINAMEQL